MLFNDIFPVPLWCPCALSANQSAFWIITAYNNMALQQCPPVSLLVHQSSSIARGIIQIWKRKMANLFSDNYWNCCGGTWQPMRLHWKVGLFSKPDSDLKFFPFLCWWHHGYIILLWDRDGRPTRWTPPCLSGKLRSWQYCSILWTSEGVEG
jgi:hypothetical protein